MENVYVSFSPNNQSVFDLVHLQIALKCLSEYHFQNAVYQESENRKRNGEKNNQSEIPLLQKKIEMFEIVSRYDETLEYLLDLVKDLPEFRCTKEQFYQELKEIMKTPSKVEVEPKLEVTAHGNLKLQNILFNYTNKRPVECKLINPNSSLQTSPVYDVLVLIYSTTDRQFRKKYFQELCAYYYDHLNFFFKDRQIELEKIYSLAEFLKEVHEYLPKMKVLSALFKVENIKSLLVENNQDVLESKTQLVDTLLDLQGYVLFKNCRLVLEDIEEIIKNKFDTLEFTVEHFELKSIGKSSGFFGDHNQLRIKIKSDQVKETEVNLFAKFYPEKCAFQEIIVDTSVFQKEIFFYTTCIRKMKQYGIHVIKDCVAPCFFTRHDDVLVFEDLVSHNYVTKDQRTYLDPNETKTVLETLGKFHAAGMLLEEKMSEERGKRIRLLDEFPTTIDEEFFTCDQDRPFAKYFITGRNAIIHLIDKFHKSENDIEGFKHFCSNIFEKASEKVKPSSKFRNTICHGDLWPTNLFLKYDKTNGSKDCKLIDLQTIRYCRPVADVIFLIFYCTSIEMRAIHLKTFLECYYKSLKATIMKHGYDPSSFYSFEELVETSDDILLHSVFQSLVYYQLTQVTDEVIGDINSANVSMHDLLYKSRNDFCEKVFRTNDNYRRRMEELILTLEEIYIDSQNGGCKVISQIISSQ